MTRRHRLPMLALAVEILLPCGCCNAEGWRAAQQGVVKLYGAGGVAGMEAYQTGVLVSAEGHILTPNTLVLDQGEVTAVLHDGRRYSGVVLGADPISDLAVVVIEPGPAALTPLSLDAPAAPRTGDMVYVLSNIFGIAAGAEQLTVQRAAVAARAQLRAQLPSGERVPESPVIILDTVTSNPGSAGGAVVDSRGRLAGILGRELRSVDTGGWLSYAVPASQLRVPYRRIRQGTAAAPAAGPRAPRIDLLEAHGFALIAEIVRRTPPYVDFVHPGSPAEAAGMRPDDLIVSVAGTLSGSVAEVGRLLARARGDAPVEVLVQRGGELIEIRLTARSESVEGAK